MRIKLWKKFAESNFLVSWRFADFLKVVNLESQIKAIIWFVKMRLSFDLIAILGQSIIKTRQTATSIGGILHPMRHLYCTPLPPTWYPTHALFVARWCHQSVCLVLTIDVYDMINCSTNRPANNSSTSSVWPNWAILKSSATNFLTKVAQIFCAL